MTDNKDKIINLENQKKQRESQTLGGLLPKIFKQFTQELKPKIITCFEALDDSLFDLAEKAESNQSQSMYFEAMRMIRKSRKQIYADFFNTIQNTFKSFKKNNYDFFSELEHQSAEEKNEQSLTLSLVDEKELDETLAKSNLINKSEMAFHKQLFALEKRFSLLASGTQLTANQIPIGPHVLVNSFAKSIKRLDIEVNLKLIIYKLFERNVMGQMYQLYAAINELLSDNGILPDIKYNIGRSSSSQSHNVNKQINDKTQLNEHPQEATQNIGGREKIHGNNSVPNTHYEDSNYQEIAQLFKQQNHNDFSTSREKSIVNNAATPPGRVDLTSMMNALSVLQSDVFTQNVTDTNNKVVNKTPIEIKDELLRQIHKIDSDSEGKVVRQKDEDTIDLVGMLFQFIVEDRNLPANIQVMLAKLQIPYLKIALQDRNIFADKSHPARVLLDSMSLASVGWSEDSDNKRVFFNRIESIVNEILESDDFNIDRFITINQEFKAFLKKAEKKSSIIQKRTEEKSLGQEKIELAKKESAQLLIDKMANIQLPAVIRDLLLGEWSNVLVLMHLRYSNESKEFQNKVDFIDRLIAASQCNETSNVTKNEIDRLSQSYEKGLVLVAFNPKEIMDKQHKLIKCLKDVHHLSDESIEQVELIAPEDILKLSDVTNKESVVAEYIEEIIEPSDEKVKFDETDDEYLQMISELKIGSWLEFLNDDKKSIRAKLSWISPITGNYLFVNSKGLKIANKQKLELAAGFREKSIILLQQVALFDRALSSIATQMKEQSS